MIYNKKVANSDMKCWSPNIISISPRTQTAYLRRSHPCGPATLCLSRTRPLQLQFVPPSLPTMCVVARRRGEREKRQDTLLRSSLHHQHQTVGFSQFSCPSISFSTPKALPQNHLLDLHHFSLELLLNPPAISRSCAMIGPLQRTILIRPVWFQINAREEVFNPLTKIIKTPLQREGRTCNSATLHYITSKDKMAQGMKNNGQGMQHPWSKLTRMTKNKANKEFFINFKGLLPCTPSQRHTHFSTCSWQRWSSHAWKPFSKEKVYKQGSANPTSQV